MLRMDGKKIIIFDLDGTLANDEQRHHHLYPEHRTGCSSSKFNELGLCSCGAKRDWNSYFAAAGGDLPFEHTIEICNSLARWHQIYILSGRSETAEEITRKWLRKHGVVYDLLRMRGKDDRTQDDILKLKWVEELGIKDRIVAVFEDRNRVVEAWRAAGYTCFQVALTTF